jgi:hypothetical protein
VLASSALALITAACGGAPAPADNGARVSPVYSEETGRLSELVSDRDGDGAVDTRAFMDGTRVARVEIDRNRDQRPDRVEFYTAAAGAPGGSVIERAEETDPSTGRVVRRETYDAGAISRVEEDTDADGRVDKWEFYERGVLSRVDLDLTGQGTANQRLTYGRGGAVERVESDPDGDGVFTLVAPGGR